MTDDASISYAANGFHLPTAPVLPADLVSAAREGLEAVSAGHSDTGRGPEPGSWKPGDDPRSLVKIEMPHAASRAIADLLRHPSFGTTVADLVGADMIQVWWVQGLIKPGGADTVTRVGWHRDRGYWKRHFTEDSHLFTAWIALADVEAAMGPVVFVPGSHRWGDDHGGNFFAQDDDDETWRQRTDWSEVEATMPAGAFSLHDWRTVHGSRPNRSDQVRYSLAVHLRSERSDVLDGCREGLSGFLDDAVMNPVVFDRRTANAG